jgi:hypothetical protein
MRRPPQSYVDITGNVYGKWTVIQRVENRHGSIYFLCRCECGFEGEVCKKALVGGKTKSCGCSRANKGWNRNAANNFKRYEPADDALIKAWYPVNGARYLMKHLNRTRLSIRHRAWKLGVHVERNVSKRHDEWSEQEKEVLRKYYPDGGVIECLKYLPKRSKNAIWVKANVLGIKLTKNVERERQREAA